MQKKRLKVIVAMSGGVDSSVAAALVKRAGFDTEGIFMKLFSSSSQAEKKAKEAARILKIPLSLLDLKKEFKKRVIDYFLRECRAGRTPNPCVVCNKEIKFGLLLEKALSLKADYIASGHYAILKKGRLFEAKDKNKDQSYFLWMLKQKQLKHILFPIGGYTKTETKKLAKKFKLPSSSFSESQEICFVPGTVNDFLAKNIKSPRGPIVNFRAKTPRVGEHRGLVFYTVGQRKGIGLSGGPYWVLAKDLKKNSLIVSKNEKDLFEKELVFKDVNWLSGKAPRFPLKIKAKIRYRSQSASALLLPSRVVFARLQRAITPGQSVVFYKRNEVLGGAFIFRSKNSKI